MRIEANSSSVGCSHLGFTDTKEGMTEGGKQ